MDDVRGRLKGASQLVVVPERAFDRLRERRDRERRRQRLASLVVAVVVGAGSLGGVALLTAGLREDPGTAVNTGWEPSRRLALHPGEYFYLRIESDEAEDGHIRAEETWWALDGSGEVRNRGTRQDKYPYPPSGTYGDGRFPIEVPHVSQLSADPDVLVAQLRDEPWVGLNGSEPDPLWDFVVRLLLETPYAAPELRAALFDVAEDIEGVTVREQGMDPVGRPAIELSTSDVENGATWTMYFDPGTHQAIAWTFSSTRGGDAWQVLYSGIVDAPGETPDGQQWLVPPLPADLP